MAWRFLSIGLFLTVMSVDALAAPVLIIDGDRVTGARGVNVNGTLYDVDFRDGTCQLLFNGCNDLSDFVFQDVASAEMASQALLDAVFVGEFDNPFDHPAAGCGLQDHSVCQPLTPYGLIEDHSVALSVAHNHSDESQDFLFLAPLNIGMDTEPRSDLTYAVWTAAVPEPHSLWLALLGVVALSTRRRKYIAFMIAALTPARAIKE